MKIKKKKHNNQVKLKPVNFIFLTLNREMVKCNESGDENMRSKINTGTHIDASSSIQCVCCYTKLIWRSCAKFVILGMLIFENVLIILFFE